MEVERQVELRFRGGGAHADVPMDLSAVCLDGPWLWLAGDEAPRLDRLHVDGPDGSAYGDRRSFALGELVDLPDGPDEEVDVEGLDRSRDYLWLVGSHSRTRKQVRKGDDEGEALDNLATVRSHPNRHVLIRLPIAEEDGEAVPVPSATSPDGRQLTAALLDGGVGGLVDVLSTDEHLAPFLAGPSKDNGLDIEGIVAVDDGVVVGLRGPVLRGWAVALELRLRDVPGRPARLALRRDGHAYRTYFLDLDGLGVRDLCRLGDDILVLAGPTTDLDGPVRLYRWHGAARKREARVVRGEQITRLPGDLPVGTDEEEGHDHAEGITLLPDEQHESVLVVYDSPASARTPAGGGVVLADVFVLPG